MWTGIELSLLLQTWRESLPQFFTDFFTVISSRVFYLVIPILLGVIFYLVIDKKKGDFLCLNTIFAYCITNLIKFIVKQPRPWVLDPEIHAPTDEAHATGYSLPSAHTAIAVAGYGSLAIVVVRKWLKAVFVVFMVLIVFARLFLCAHTPIDVIVGIALAVAIIAVNWYLLKLSYENERNYYIVAAGYVIASAAVSIVTIALMDMDQSNVLTGLGFLFGYTVGRLCEHRFVKYEIPDVSVGRKAAICIIGAAVTLALSLSFMMIGGIWGFIGGFLSMIWLSALFPYIVKKKLS